MRTKTFLSLVLCTSMICLMTVQIIQADNSEILQNIFSRAVVRDFSSLDHLASALNPEWAKTVNISSWNSTCFNSANNFSASSDCLQTPSQCLSLKDLWTLYNIAPDQSLTHSHLSDISPAVLYSLVSCSKQDIDHLLGALEDEEKDHHPPSSATWGYSFLFVTLINLASVTGAIVLPCMHTRIYKLVLMFMVALAVGTLAGSSLLFLIPEAFLLVHDEDAGYIWKSTTIIGGIYLFYITEKLMRTINSRRQKSRSSSEKHKDDLATKDVITTSFRPIPIDTSMPEKDTSRLPKDAGWSCEPHRHTSSGSQTELVRAGGSFARSEDDVLSDESVGPISVVSNGGNGYSHSPGSSEKSDTNNTEKPSQHGHSHNHNGGEIAPVAYMIIFGDALHNFIDGLSIGSAFTQSTLTGVSVSVAVLCEELPHELGDFAILLNSGMHFKKAIMYNFLSACTCYVGTAVGIALGENTSSHEWIFAIAGGMFLYISLVDMVPEMNSASETKEGKEFGELRLFLLQNLGLLTGYGILLIFAVFGGNIDFE